MGVHGTTAAGRWLAATIVAAGLVASPARKGTTITLTWTPPGDDWLCGTPARYEIRNASGTLAATGTSGGRVTVPGAKGDRFTVAYVDEAGNWGLPAAFPAAP